LEAFLVSTALVAVSEIGDKTQLLAILLVARHRAPLPIVLGILVATAANHSLAAWGGVWLATMIGEQATRWIVGASFLAMAAWALVPDKLERPASKRDALGVFGTTLVAFFLVEMGDKTQLATIALAAHYGTVLPVVAGTTLGMMLADVPAVYLGERILRNVPLKIVRLGASATFAVLGVLTLLAPAMQS
jgi:putative Ca2+/H+ antiporter (TMEM165/GDT1 family)